MIKVYIFERISKVLQDPQDIYDSIKQRSAHFTNTAHLMYWHPVLDLQGVLRNAFAQTRRRHCSDTAKRQLISRDSW
jgi:5-bromo-4-chloroindolyl phosphate hydrolysis protein